jgi:hypothetical protein
LMSSMLSRDKEELSMDLEVKSVIEEFIILVL